MLYNKLKRRGFGAGGMKKVYANFSRRASWRLLLFAFCVFKTGIYPE